MLGDLIENSSIRIVTLEEGVLAGGFGSAVLEFAAQRRIRKPGARQAEVACLGIADHFVEHGSRSILLEQNGLSADKVADFVLDFWRAYS
jgi:1-deoxy-D-xylulose-5-phosphate synthase